MRWSDAHRAGERISYRGDCCVPSLIDIDELESEFICDMSRLSLLTKTDGADPPEALFVGSFLIVAGKPPVGFPIDCCCCCFLRCFIDCCCCDSSLDELPPSPTRLMTTFKGFSSFDVSSGDVTDCCEGNVMDGTSVTLNADFCRTSCCC